MVEAEGGGNARFLRRDGPQHCVAVTSRVLQQQRQEADADADAGISFVGDCRCDWSFGPSCCSSGPGAWCVGSRDFFATARLGEIGAGAFRECEIIACMGARRTPCASKGQLPPPPPPLLEERDVGGFGDRGWSFDGEAKSPSPLD